jgi:D-3-phosphoglycerate dehydrogenase
VKILVCDPIHYDGLQKLINSGIQIDIDTKITSEQLLDKISVYDGLIIRSRTKITRDVLDAAVNLKAIGRAGVGLDNVDLQYAKKKGVEVFNSPESSSNAVAELVLGMMFNMARKIKEANTSMKQGKWEKKRLTGFEIKGKTLGIIGFGRIGCLLGMKARALGMRVIAHDIALGKVREYIEETGAEVVDLDTLYSESDFITVHVPLLPETIHMISTKEFKKMKKSVFLINTARGGVVDETALKKALDLGEIRGAALDVYEDEPKPDADLICRENVICTPHIGAGSEEAQIECSTIVAEKLINFFKSAHAPAYLIHT